MKHSLFFTHTLSIVSILYISISFAPIQYLDAETVAQNNAQLSLPEGARARLGKGIISDIAYSKDGNHLIVSSSIGTWTYDAHTGKALDLFNVYPLMGNISGLSPDGSMVAIGSRDHTAALWDLTTRQQKSNLIGHTGNIYSMAFSPDGKTFATGNWRKTVQLWHVDTGQHLVTFDGKTEAIRPITFSPDGKTLATGGVNGTIHLWDISSGKLRATLEEHIRSISALAFSPDGKTLASVSSQENNVELWDAVTGEHKQTLKSSSGISRLTFSPDSRTLATSAGADLRLWDLASGMRKASLTGHVAEISSIVFSPDGRTLVSGGNDELYLWDSLTGAQKGTITGHTIGYSGFALSPDGRTVATGSREKIYLWDTVTLSQKAMLFESIWGNTNLAFSPDGRTLASEIGWNVRFWDVATGTHKSILKTYFGRSTGGLDSRVIAFSPDGRFFASGSSQKTIQLWLADGRTHIATLSGHVSRITAITFSPDGQTLASGSDDDSVRLWNVNTKTHIITLTGHTDKILSVAFSPDGKILASAGWDQTIRLWDTMSGEHIRTLVGHTSWITSVAFSPDGKTLASGGGWADGTVRLWDVDTGIYKATLPIQTYMISGVIFSPDGTILLTGNSDGTVLLWDFTPTTDITVRREDVNSDGVVNHHDLTFVASRFGQSSANDADVNADGIVNIVDLVLVVGSLGAGDSAPAAHSKMREMFTIADVQLWLTHAQQVDNTTPTFQRGVAILERLLGALAPKRTALLPNYPNPFNPETWIPYQLSTPAEVTVHIYTANGTLVRTLRLGYRPAGKYRDRKAAAYWDGKNSFGEPVASGVYLYTLSAGQTSMTRRMVIRK